VVGDLLGAVVGDVAGDDAAPARGGDVDVVVADPAADDRPAARQGGERPLRQPDVVVDQQHVGAGPRLGDDALVAGLEQ
jgi:hypothetical protein